MNELTNVSNLPGLNEGNFVTPALEATKEHAAFELKFALSVEQSFRLQDWALQHMRPDSHGSEGAYRVTSLYCDTPELDVYHRSPGHRRNKFRVRRYRNESDLFLEQKKKRKSQVIKRRLQVGPDWQGPCLNNNLDTQSPEDWFSQQIVKRRLQPVCLVSYHRTAFNAVVSTGTIRLTIDRNLAGKAYSNWGVPHLDDGRVLHANQVVMEMKFFLHIPDVFRQALTLLGSPPPANSKYRRCVEMCCLERPS